MMSLDIKPAKFFPNLETKAWFWIKDLVLSVLWCCQGVSQPLKHVALLLLSCQFKNRSGVSKLSQLLMMFFGGQGTDTGWHRWWTWTRQTHRQVATWVRGSTSCPQHNGVIPVTTYMRTVIFSPLRNTPNSSKSLDWGRVHDFSPLSVQTNWCWELVLWGRSRGKYIFPFHSFFVSHFCYFLLFSIDWWGHQSCGSGSPKLWHLPLFAYTKVHLWPLCLSCCYSQWDVHLVKSRNWFQWNWIHRTAFV